MFDAKKIEQAVRMILEAIGEDPEREGLRNTPRRVARMYQEVFAGLEQDPAEAFSVLYTEQHEELVLVKDIPFYSMCEHHFLPFFGKVHLGYIPRKGRVVGLSKLVRGIEIYAKRPQLQERLTKQIADALMEYVRPLGVMVIIEAEHMCMTMRGVKKPGSVTVTSAVRGVLHDDEALRSEALALIKG
ncbi:MAG: GTP cyclohydrolase I FolE [Moorellaceae bacterium]